MRKNTKFYALRKRLTYRQLKCHLQSVHSLVLSFTTGNYFIPNLTGALGSILA